jgi:endonuclease/exonuclease/phosphatase (EEP) superfamily protein YafD
MKVYTWNVLNPSFAAMTWSGFDVNAAAWALKDRARDSYRLNAIATVVRHWLRGKEVVVCLQEVWPALRTALQSEYGDRSAFTEGTDCRATLVSGFRILRARALPLPAAPPKSALLCTLERGDRSVEVANVHLHWKWRDLSAVAQALRGAQIVAGDFNKEWGALPFLQRGSRLHGFTAVNPATNHLAVIDHILVSKEFKATTKILTQAAGYTLPYDFQAILRLTQPWLDARPNQDLSDHAPLLALVTPFQKTKKRSFMRRSLFQRLRNAF